MRFERFSPSKYQFKEKESKFVEDFKKKIEEIKEKIKEISSREKEEIAEILERVNENIPRTTLVGGVALRIWLDIKGEKVPEMYGKDFDFVLPKEIFERVKLALSPEKYKESSNAFTLGRGLAYPIALEAALKLKEAAMIHSEGFAVREFLHGPVQLVDENTPVLLFITSEEGLEESIKALQKIKQYNAPVIYVGPKSDKAKEYCTDFIEIEKIDDELMPIPLVKAAQLFAYHISVLRGLNPDKPTKLSKVVTY